MSMFSMLRVKMVLKQITNELWFSAYVGLKSEMKEFTF